MYPSRSAVIQLKSGCHQVQGGAPNRSVKLQEHSTLFEDVKRVFSENIKRLFSQEVVERLIQLLEPKNKRRLSKFCFSISDWLSQMTQVVQKKKKNQKTTYSVIKTGQEQFSEPAAPVRPKPNTGNAEASNLHKLLFAIHIFTTTFNGAQKWVTFQKTTTTSAYTDPALIRYFLIQTNEVCEVWRWGTRKRLHHEVTRRLFFTEIILTNIITNSHMWSHVRTSVMTTPLSVICIWQQMHLFNPR